MSETEYTRGYRAGHAFGRLEAEERIIELLEQSIGHGDPEGDSYFMDAIALIRGENK
jgi:hypothetical protein